jgi:putative NADH-flavin reductase
MKNIVAQMEKMDVNRIIAVGGLGLLQADEETIQMDTEDFPKEYLGVSMEHKKALSYLQASTLNWTFVCPPSILNEGPTGNMFTAANFPPSPNNYKINAGDLALFMLTELERNEFIKQRVGISN